ncbi:DNA polymerase-3 subunit beta [Nocardiopsis sp. Huas11]|uniref:DNA polymerase III subunit beta n=1 Tax=Nocardiopsis sp. Huas11 TaxID=2183912 RepID=UPI000EAD97A1|nr:DNA polymerase III subunit beta [Nocardiopsis sp. Huas11]RKS10005.1 DNA polymerase-3 subunit beta [Nocardiopsis sp. Huas11]
MPTITITATAAVLSDQVGWAARLLPARPAIPVLAGLRLDISTDRVRVTSTDYEVWASADVEADTEGEGVAVLPGRLMAGLLAKLPPLQMVTITIGPDRARITCGPTRATLLTLPAEDYPTPPPAPAAVGRADAAELAGAVDQVVVAASTDPTLAALTGVHTTLAEDGIVMCASDRYRVARQSVAWEPVLDQEDGADPVLLVPAAALSQAAKAMTGTVSIATATDDTGRLDQLSLSDDTRRLSTRLLDGDFPRTDSFLERARQDAQLRVTVEAAHLAAAVDRVKLFAAADTPIRVAITDEGLEVRAGHDGDAGSEDVPAQVDGEGLQVAFNAPFLLTGLASARTMRMRVAVSATDRPVLFTPDADGDGYQYLVMPIRLGSASA